jgi:predicted subunit of tRNA(5-methylaminomethyl-2-thiouridylate) methyltransferase
MGFSRKTVNLMTRRYFEIEEGNNLYTSDYEFEVRSYMRDRGVDPSIVFPKNHVQSIVRARKDGYGQEDAWKKVEISESI